MTTTTVEKGRWYPNPPPRLFRETDEEHTARLTGADGTDRYPYDHRRYWQCSIGWHSECTDRTHSGGCECPHHAEVRDAERLVREWNAKHPPGTWVRLPNATPPEPPTRTTGPAYVQDGGWPVVELDGFADPVWLSWLEPR